eukprot:12700319-Ditylum_brightwellii.AAC.1
MESETKKKSSLRQSNHCRKRDNGQEEKGEAIMRKLCASKGAVRSSKVGFSTAQTPKEQTSSTQ